MKTINLLLITALFACACYAQPSPDFNGTPLIKANKTSVEGFEAQRILELRNFLKNRSATTGMIVMHDGKVVFEYGNLQELSYLASCRKSMLAMLYGKHVENGTINLNQTIGSLEIDDNQPLSEKEKRATIDHIITSRSGVFHIPANGGYDKKNILKRGSVEPGEYFVYNNWDFNVAGYILEQKTGKTVYEEFEEQIAKPLGFEDWQLKKQRKSKNRKKSRYDAYHLYLSTRDMAKIGQLMLNKGEWKGKKVLSKDWVKKITSTVTPVETVNERQQQDSNAPIQFSYGYMWWLFEKLNDNPNIEGAFTASGYGGQFITVIPKQKIVIAHKTKLPFLVQAGLKKGGTPSWMYWEIVDRVSKAKKE